MVGKAVVGASGAGLLVFLKSRGKSQEEDDDDDVEYVAGERVTDQAPAPINDEEFEIMSSLRMRMMQVEAEKELEQKKKEEEEGKSDYKGGTAMLERPDADSPLTNVEENAQELESPILGRDDGGDLLSDIDNEPTGDEESIAMLKRMFGDN